MPKRITLIDNKNGVSIVVDDKQDGTSPKVDLRDDTPANACALNVDPGKHADLYKQIVTLATTLNGAEVTAGAPVLDYIQTDYGVSNSTIAEYSVSGFSSNATKGQVAGDFSNLNGLNLAQTVKEQCKKLHGR